jgi:hypothetical protein
MGKTSGPNASIRQNDIRQFPALSSTPNDPRCRELNATEKARLAEMLGTEALASQELLEVK